MRRAEELRYIARQVGRVSVTERIEEMDVRALASALRLVLDILAEEYEVIERR